MSFDWREYLELAKELVSRTSSGYSSEAAHRSAVSRAYYSAFCWARNYAEGILGFKRTKTAQDHELLRTYLKGQGKAQLASVLDKLRQWRNRSDYDDVVPHLDRYVQHAIPLAGRVIRECR